MDIQNQSKRPTQNTQRENSAFRKSPDNLLAKICNAEFSLCSSRRGLLGWVVGVFLVLFLEGVGKKKNQGGLAGGQGAQRGTKGTERSGPKKNKKKSGENKNIRMHICSQPSQSVESGGSSLCRPFWAGKDGRMRHVFYLSIYDDPANIRRLFVFNLGGWVGKQNDL